MSHESDNSILYWPGMRYNPGELEMFFSHMRSKGFVVRIVKAPYDVGPLPAYSSSLAHQEVLHSDTPAGGWWIGLSLGAAVAHIVCSTVFSEKRPRRLTLINPFADRVELSIVRGFALGDQWRIRPEKYRVPPGISVDLILSLRDERIPLEQGLRLQSLWSDPRSRVVWTDSDHIISDFTEQQRLAKLLLQYC